MEHERLQTILKRTRDGILVVTLAPIPGMTVAVAAGLPVKTALVGRLLANKAAKKVKAAGEVGAPIAWTDVDDDVSTIDKQRGGSGFAAGQVTWAIGESWLETCDHFWALSYSHAPRDLDPALVAERFADDLYDRLPRYLQRWEDRVRRRAAAEGIEVDEAR